MKNAILSVTLVIIILVSGIFIMSVECRVPPDKQGLLASCFYPKVYGLAYSLPYLYAKKHNVLHIRSAETGILLESVPIGVTEEPILYDNDSVFTINTDNDSENTATYRRIDADGSVEEYTIPYIGMSQYELSEYEFRREHFVVNNEPVVIYIEKTYDDIKDCLVECRMYAESPSRKLWERVVTNEEFFTFAGNNNQLSNADVVVIYKGNESPDDKSSSIMMIEISTGETIYSTDELIFQANFFTGNDSFGVFFQEENITKIIDLKDGQVIHEYVRETIEPNLIKCLDDSIWITRTQKGSSYRYGVSNGFTLQKLDFDGEIVEEVGFIPKIVNDTIIFSEVLTDDTIMLLSNHCTYLYNFRTNQRLKVIPYKVDSMYMHEDTLVYQTDRRLVALDAETFEKRWELESIELGRVRMIETENQFFFGYKYTTEKQNCCQQNEYRMIIRVVNKDTGYQEPYEYDFPFKYNNMDFIYPSTYGLIAVDRYEISCLAPSNVPVYEIGGFSHPVEIIETDDPRFIMIRCVHVEGYGYLYELDTKMGVLSIIEKHIGKGL